MKRFILLLLCVSLVGCSAQEGPASFFGSPENLIRDPHFAEYKEKRDMLESKYLAKEITFAEYQEGKKELDDRYTHEVEKREGSDF